ncbi:hypothetical protein Ahy_B08g092428 isoform F [Arachis hypogaea]|uniref:Uncharacterized protein n=1 Tax=Arachis hypogaea TaxID=3818 RepID=A0A444Y3U8_ARAHY|nr:hypothetical protein Ahy_B08g092428 isoform F [Arachis hypogaea]
MLNLKPLTLNHWAPSSCTLPQTFTLVPPAHCLRLDFCFFSDPPLSSTTPSSPSRRLAAELLPTLSSCCSCSCLVFSTSLFLSLGIHLPLLPSPVILSPDTCADD